MTGPLFDSTTEPLEPVFVPPAQPFVDDTISLLGHFVEVVTEARAPSPDGKDHLATLALVHACWESATAGTRVQLHDFCRRRGIQIPS